MQSAATCSAPGPWRRTSLVLGLWIGLLMAPADATPAPFDASFDYLYIVANEEGASGGHAAVRLGAFVYHFQNDEGLLVLQRDRIDDFLFDYALLENRTIHVSRVEVTRDDLDRIVERFRQRHRAQDAQIGVGRALSRDRELLEALAEQARRGGSGAPNVFVPVPGLAYFDRAGHASQATAEERAAESLTSLGREVAERYGGGFLARRRAALLGELQALQDADPLAWRVDPPTSAYDHPAFARAYSDRWTDIASGLAAIDVLNGARRLDPSTHHAQPHEAFALSDEDVDALGRYADGLRGRLLELVDSRRADWGEALLVGMARLLAARASVERRHLVVLDSFPDPGVVDRVEMDLESPVGRSIRQGNLRAYEASWSWLREQEEPGELAWERVEERANRYLEVAGPGRRRIRVAKGHLVPAQAREFAVPAASGDDPDRAFERVSSARQRERSHARQLKRIHGYGLITRNCVTALFDTLNESFGGSVDLTEAALGGWVSGEASLAFIPFVSAHQVNERYRVGHRETIPSYRQLRVRQMKEEGNDLWVALRESNTFSARSYRLHRDDSFFIFFTDQTLLLRPLLGAFNLVAGLTESVAGLVAAPIDRGRILGRGLRGTFMSLPELVFWNIRKGTYGWIPPEHRDHGTGAFELGMASGR